MSQCTCCAIPAILPWQQFTNLSNALFAPITVVVVDDNRDAADTLTLLFNVTGHTAHAAYDAASGMKLMQGLEPDLAVFDLDLPDMDGCAALKRLLEVSPQLGASSCA